jgi:hypothetical protein
MASGVQPYARTHVRARAHALRRGVAATRLLGVAERNSFVALAVATCASLLLARLPGTLGGDAWLLLAAGRELMDGGLPQHDTLTVWSQGERWVDQQWAAQLLFYGVHAVAGIKGLVLVNAALIVAAYAFALGVARGLGASGRSTALVGLAAIPALVPHTAVRAQTLAYPLFVALLTLLIVESRKGSSRRVLLALPILVVWANVHGSVLLGGLLVTLFAGVEAVRRLRGRGSTGWGVVGVLAVAPWACVLASPYGLALVDYYRATVTNPVFAQVVGEWGPSSFPAQAPFFALAGVGTWIVARNRALTAFEKAAFVVTLVAGVVAVRSVVWFVLVALVVLPVAVDALWPDRTRQRRARVNLLLAGAAVLVVGVGFAAAAARQSSMYLDSYREAAVQAIGSAVVDPEKRIFANERFADWLIWEHPELAGRVAFDARFELLESDELKAIARWRGRSGDDWRAAAKGYDLLVLDAVSEDDVARSLIRDGSAWFAYGDGRLNLIVVRPSSRP